MLPDTGDDAVENGVGGDDGQGMFERGRGQKPVEGVAVVPAHRSGTKANGYVGERKLDTLGLTFSLYIVDKRLHLGPFTDPDLMPDFIK